ncbi:fluoride ion transporter CrcB [Corynebacterium yudongzhengii]|uniref:Fluoride-specific ion channel FluC n=1 Tax=Corynebacterium yudongzhengii TaxID=2080740 RepID=A0A2U1T8N8_9CORY|nr:CrcB family protein [Corynebacterium yudongzhengii]AWB82567.1 fluoride ion transporter CrcB [Corynebacterium yudongzhengii]PWC02377.1 fluoride ion transporter CrcB [Corynebacterium yudongzhengii]
MFSQAFFVGLGAALGATLRWGLTEAVGIPVLVVLGINIAGCFFAGWMPSSAFWTTGFLGGFTTMSAFAFHATEMNLPTALAYTAATVLGCVLSALAGRALRRPREEHA